MKISKTLSSIGLVAGLALTNVAFAISPSGAGGGDASDWSSLTNLQTSVNQNAGTLFNIVMIIATLAGLILIIKGLVHLKQNYTGSSQEKHLSKGIASLVFGVALVLAIPISHMLVGTIGTGVTFNTNASSVNFSSQ